MPERIIAERYELESQLGSGGMGTVWKARDRLLERTVAVKLLHDALASDSSFADRFRHEARAAASLTHPNIAGVHDTGEAALDGSDVTVPFIVMEFVEGESLGDRIRRTGPLPMEEVARIARAVLSALAHSHDHGLIHRDIKPANILVDATTGTTKVVDFGIAKGRDDSGVLTNTSGLIGTASYMSPEQIDGERATPASDLYAVGCLMYCCLAGEPPFGGSSAVAIAMRHLKDPVPSLHSRRSDIPPALEAVVMQALQKNPARRFASAQQMDRAIAAVGLDPEGMTQTWAPDTATETIRVLLVDDHDLVIKGLVAIFSFEPDIEIVATAGSAAEGKAHARTLEPDVILLDNRLPDGDGVSVAKEILAESPRAKIVMLTGSDSDSLLAEAVEAGCVGFIDKAQDIDVVVDAVRAAHAGEAPISPYLLARLLPRLRRQDAPPD